MIDTKIIFDSKDIQDKLNQIMSNNGNDNLWYKVASALFSKVILNIQNGIDINGKKFKSYTPQYQKFRTRRGLGLNVNLQLSSNMIRHIVIKADKDGFVIYFSGKENQDKAEWNDENGRKFFGWGSETLNEFDRILQREIDKIFRGL